MSTYAYMYRGNVQQKNPLCAASCVTKNIYHRCKFSNLTSTPMYSSRLYAKNPVFEIVHEERVKVYHLHMHNGDVQQNPLCVKSCVTKEFPISPRFSLAFFHRGAMRCTSFVSIMHQALFFCSLCPLSHGRILGMDVWLENSSVSMFTEYHPYEKEHTPHYDWSKCTTSYTPEPKLMHLTD